MFMALEDHFDLGFGATADSFRQAADVLQSHEADLELDDLRHLPENYLRRHACELYLKSGIVIVHRSFGIHYGKNDPQGQPFVLVKKDWQPFHRVHTIGVLFAHWSAFIEDNSRHLKLITGDDWSIPPKMREWVALVDASDPQSTLFRYPTTKNRELDKAKSRLKPMPVKDIMPPGKKGGFLFLDRVRDIVKAYRTDAAPMGDVHVALRDLVQTLSHFHLLMRAKLTRGL